MAPGRVSFRPVTESDFPLLGEWLAEPHVRRWWNHDPSPAGVARDFGPGTRGEEAGEDLVALLDDRPVGLVQRSRLEDYAEEFESLAALVEVPSGALTIDYLLGSLDDVGRGIGTAVILALVEDSWTAYPEATAILEAIVVANTASWRALEKAGFTRIGEGELEPDNPVDERLHYLYRLDRPVRP